MKIHKIGKIVFVIFTVLLILNVKSPSTFGWYNTEWKFRVPIQVNYAGTSTVENYQLKLTVDYLDGMKCDFSDLMFTQVVNGVETELPYFVESYNECENAIIWIKMSKLNVGNNIVYMYFGNENAASKSNPDSVFILYDDFEGSSLDTEKWGVFDVTDGDIISVSEGYLRMIYSGGELIDGAEARIFSKKKLDMSKEYIIEWEGTFYHTPGYKGIVVAFTNTTGYLGFVYYDTGTGNYRHDLRLEVKGKQYNEILYGIAEPISGEFQLIKGKDFSECVLPTGDKIHSNHVLTGEGKVSLWVDSWGDYGDNIVNASWDWVRVRMYAYPEPTYSFGNVEKKSTGVPCTSDDECESGHCAVDYDEDGAWCMPPTSCAHDGTEYKDGAYAPECYSWNKAIRCVDGEWKVTSCGLFRLCKNGRCVWKDSDGDGVRDKNDQCPNTPKGCEVYDNGCPKAPFTYYIKNDVSASCPGSSIPVDPEHKCLSTAQNPTIKFYLRDGSGNLYPGNSDPYCDPLHGTEGWHDAEDGRYYCEFSIPSTLPPGTYTLIAKYDLGGRTYQDIIKTGFVVESQCSLNVRCGHGGRMTSTPAVSVSLSGCKNIGGTYYCKSGSSIDITQINTVVPHCSNGAWGGSVTPGILAWVYSGNVMVAEKDNKYAGCSLPSPFSNHRKYLYSLTVGFRWPCNIGWGSGAQSKSIYGVYTFQNPGHYTLYIDMINAVCDSPDYICPTKSTLCAIGSMSNDWWGFEEIARYNIYVIDPEVTFVSVPSTPQIFDGKEKLEITWKLKNTGVGKINLVVTPLCPSGWTCEVSPQEIKGMTVGQEAYVTLKLYNKKPAQQVSTKEMEVGIKVRYSDAYGLSITKEDSSKTRIVLDNKAPEVSLSAPDGYGWSASSLRFKITCDDNPYDSGYGTYGGCSKIYYLVVNENDACPQDLSSYNTHTSTPQEVLNFEGEVSCPSGNACKKKVCFAGEDRFSQRSEIHESGVFKIDREPPELSSEFVPNPVLSSVHSTIKTSKEHFYIKVKCDDKEGSGCSQIRVTSPYLECAQTSCSDSCSVTTTCESQLEFISPYCEVGKHEYEYTAIVKDAVGNENSRTYSLQVKWNEGCTCSSSDECYPGSSCRRGVCGGGEDDSEETGGDTGTFTGHTHVEIMSPQVSTTSDAFLIPVGSTYRIILSVKNEDILPETYVIEINSNPKYPWNTWVCFEGKCGTNQPRKYIVTLERGEEVRIPFLIHAYQLTINPVNINISLNGIVLGSENNLNLKFKVVPAETESAEGGEMPGIGVVNLLAISILATLFVAFLI